MSAIRVTVWNENVHERTHDAVKKVYPTGMHNTIAEALRKLGGSAVDVRTATLEQPEHGLSQEVVDSTDVMLWWGHCAHDQVQDEIVARVQKRVLEGMGLLVLHSGHFSKIFKRLMGTNCSLKWREIGEKERVWTIEPSHPIAEGIDEYIELPNTEMYGERFDIPQPDKLVFISWYEGGEVFRSGCCFDRSQGRIFYFSPGHETLPIYYHPQIQRVLWNAVRWAAPRIIRTDVCPNAPALEKVTEKAIDFSNVPHMKK
jgi:trehalose utilization protein